MGDPVAAWRIENKTKVVATGFGLLNSEIKRMGKAGWRVVAQTPVQRSFLHSGKELRVTFERTVSLDGKRWWDGQFWHEGGRRIPDEQPKPAAPTTVNYNTISNVSNVYEAPKPPPPMWCGYCATWQSPGARCPQCGAPLR